MLMAEVLPLVRAARPAAAPARNLPLVQCVGFLKRSHAFLPPVDEWAENVSDGSKVNASITGAIIDCVRQRAAQGCGERPSRRSRA